MFSVGLWQVQVGMARALRAAFKHHHQFKWDPDPAVSKISIYDEWPLAAIKYPAIISSVGPGSLLQGHRGIGDEYAGVDITPISVNGLTRSLVTREYKSGTNEISVVLTIQARSAYEALQMADWSALFIRSFSSDKFQREGLYVKDIRSSPPSPALVGSEPLYTVQLTVVCLTEFSRIIPISVQQTVDGICLVGVFSTLPDGTTYGETYS